MKCEICRDNMVKNIILAMPRSLGYRTPISVCRECVLDILAQLMEWEDEAIDDYIKFAYE